MGRPRKTQSMSDGKKEIIARLIDEYDIKSTADIQDHRKMDKYRS